MERFSGSADFVLNSSHHSSLPGISSLVEHRLHGALSSYFTAVCPALRRCSKCVYWMNKWCCWLCPLSFIFYKEQMLPITITNVFLPGKSHGQRSLVGYSPWGHKESDMTERLHFHFLFFTIIKAKTNNGAFKDSIVACRTDSSWFALWILILFPVNPHASQTWVSNF